MKEFKKIYVNIFLMISLNDYILHTEHMFCVGSF
jgi:hypothetical protein